MTSVVDQTNITLLYIEFKFVGFTSSLYCNMAQEDKAAFLFETITKELVSIIEDSENCESGTIKKSLEGHVHSSENFLSSTSQSKINSTQYEPSSKNLVLNATNLSNIEGDINTINNDLDKSHELFQSIRQRFEKINFSGLTDRIKDLSLHEQKTKPISSIVEDLKHTFDKQYTENRLSNLTKEIQSAFRNQPGEFGDIPEISEFFRACSILEHTLVNLTKQRNDCLKLQKRMTKVAEVSYDRINNIQQEIAVEQNINSQENTPFSK